MTDRSLPVYRPGEIDSDRTPTLVHGTILAAGKSERYGSTNKLLADIDGEPVVRCATRTLVDADTDGVTVITGHESERVGDALSDLPVSIRENPAYERGQSTTVREAVRTARERHADAVIIALGDMPYVSRDSIDALVEAYERGAGDAIAPAHGGTRGNPVLFDSAHFEALLDVTGDIGGREILLSSEGSVLLSVSDPGVLRDIDRPADLPPDSREGRDH